ncbi:MAG: two-component regulator propeller domain-containing protein, partial [Bacteroidota bacterium]
MMRRFKAILLFFVLFPVCVVQLQGQTYPIRAYSIESGLSESVVNDVIQDRDGYLWMATGYGLNRFDGIEFLNYFEEHGLNSNRVRSLYQDRTGKIWIGTEQGVNVWMQDSLYRFSELEALQQEIVISIMEDSNGELWFGTDGSGAWQLERTGGLIQYSTAQGLRSNQVRAMAEDPKGGIWFATRNGLTVLENGNLQTYTMNDGLPENRLRDVLIGPGNHIWVGTRNGVSRFDGKTFTNWSVRDGLVSPRVRTLSMSKDSLLWIGTEAGVSSFDGSVFERFTADEGLTNTIIYSSTVDKEGNIWMGTYGGGVNQILGTYFRNYTVSQGLPNNLVTTFSESSTGEFWVGTFGGGLIQFKDGLPHHMGIDEGLPDDRVFTITHDSKDRLWIGMQWGLARIENERIQTYPIQQFPFRRIRDVMEASDGSFWVASYDSGLVNITENVEIKSVWKEANGLPDNTVLAIVEAADGSIWIATYGGVSRLKDGEITNYSMEEGVPNNGVMGIIRDQNNAIWISTFGGIAWFDGRRFRSITEEDGLPERVCYFIEQDNDGLFWIGTKSGVVRFNVQQFYSDNIAEREQAFQLITSEQGLVGDEMNLGAVYEDREGHLWFGGVEGLSHFFPTRYKGSFAAPEVSITGLRASGRPISLKKSPKLSHDQNLVEIQFSGISFTSPEQVLYEYKLDDIDLEWQRTSERLVRYPSLPPGKYTFRVHARNSNGMWSGEYATVDFSINAPYWMQWWFVMLLILIVAGILFMFYYNYRIKKMIDIERMRVRIASDLHDDVGASLTEVALQSDFLQASNLDNQYKKTLSQIGDQCRKIVTSLDDIVWSIDARNDTVGDFTDRMQDYINNVLSQKNMQVLYNFEELNMGGRLP